MTNVAYPDLEERSPNGRFLLEARSPDNGTISDREGSWDRPNRFSIGQVIAVSREGQELLRIQIGPNPSKNETLSGMWLNDPLPRPAPQAAWIPRSGCESSAGYLWTGGSQRYFFTHESATYFVWRVVPDHRLVVCFHPPGLLDLVPPGVEAALRDAEDRATDRQLATAGWLADREEADWKEPTIRQRVSRCRREVLGALASLVRRPRLEAQASLRVASQISRGYAGLFAGFDDCEWIRWIGFRPAIQQILRRLGLSPTEPAYRFYDDFHMTSWFDPAEHSSRCERWEQLRPGLALREVVEVVGCPDFVNVESPEWLLEYDEALPSQRTTTVVLTAGGLVEEDN